jgi:hypothetical protein
MRYNLTWAMALLFLAIAGPAARAADRLPNLVISLTDDQGYADVGKFGAEGFTTPRLDRMADEGAVFRNFHVTQPVCSASRCALLTGCYPNRLGIHNALGPRSKVGISDHEVTLAQLLKTRGYATGMFGKWHLGDSPQFMPLRHGFDTYFGLPLSCDWFYYEVNELQAVTSGDGWWKLQLPHTYVSVLGQKPGRDGVPGEYAHREIKNPELYDLAHDLSETIDVSAQHPDVVKQLQAEVEKARAELGDALTKRKGAGTREPGRLTTAAKPQQEK